MVREEILTGLNNGVARGESIEKAMQTLVLAGYNPKEVQEASQHVNMGTVGTIPQTQNQSNNPLNPLPKTEEPKKKNQWIKIALLVVALLLLIGLGIFIMFGDSIINALFPPA